MTSAGRRFAIAPAARWLSAEGCLDLLPPEWQARLSESRQRSPLSQAAEWMPPIPRVGLEVRLGSTAGQIDLHQQVFAVPAEQSLLLEHFAKHPAEGRAFHALTRFLRLWADPDRPLSAAFPSLYLEFDQPHNAAANTQFPCLFLDVHRRLGEGEDRQRREDLTLGLVREALDGAGLVTPRSLVECFHNIPAGASIGHLGLMFGRDDGALRINIKQLRRGTLLPFLAAIDWPGDKAAADSLFSLLLDQADRVTVALDLCGHWQNSIGFEVFFEHAPAQDPRWKRLLEWFCAEQLASTAECADLLNFPATIVPSPGAPPWPASWIIGAALAPSDHLPYFKRYLSHLKINTDAAGRRQAKAYLGMIHDWHILSVPAESRDTTVPEPDSAAHMLKAQQPRSARLSHAITKGVEFLASRITQGGYWRDFHLQIGFGDEWVTAFIACQLLDTGRETGRALAARAWQWLLRRQRDAGGWGFNGVSPPDADSTAWVLRLAGQLEADEPCLERARAFLALHWLSEGGVATYAPTTPLLFDGELLSTERRCGWSAAHACVTANAAPFLPPAALAYLRQQQRTNGAWQAYWWRDDLFATALAATTLRQSSSADEPAGDQAQIERAVAWAWSGDSSDRSAFDRAWEIRLASLAPDRVATTRLVSAIDRLLQQQLTDGAWPAGAAMLFPLPWQQERSLDGSAYLDQDRCFTTATVIAALCHAERSLIPGAL